jgi:hypothetical protein
MSYIEGMSVEFKAILGEVLATETMPYCAFEISGINIIIEFIYKRSS